MSILLTLGVIFITVGIIAFIYSAYLALRQSKGDDSRFKNYITDLILGIVVGTTILFGVICVYSCDNGDGVKNAIRRTAISIVKSE